MRILANDVMKFPRVITYDNFRPWTTILDYKDLLVFEAEIDSFQVHRLGHQYILFDLSHVWICFYTETEVDGCETHNFGDIDPVEVSGSSFSRLSGHIWLIRLYH